jgi:hypothetical protein
MQRNLTRAGSHRTAVENVSVETLPAAYDAEMWRDLYVMVGGAADALTGLLFVAVAITWTICRKRVGAARRDPASTSGTSVSAATPSDIEDLHFGRLR